MKKKAGLITYHASHNYGSILQTIAMENILRSQHGYDVEIINYESIAQQNLYSLYSKQGWPKGYIKNVAISMLYKSFKKRHDEFSETIKSSYSSYSKKIENINDLKLLSSHYDIIISGSDQIWNTNCIDFTDIYYLPFNSPAKKIAYAPSFGGKNILKSPSADSYKEYIRNYDYVSAREDNGVKWIKKLTGIDAPLVADPTLVADPAIYDLIPQPERIPEKYIFFYGVPFHKSMYQVLRNVSKHYNLPIVMIDIKTWVFGFNFMRGFKLSDSAKLGNYLSLIKNAEFVITTSFHGSIFSSIYETPFWYLTYRNTNPDDDRLDTLLRLMGLTDRKIFSSNTSDIDFYSPIDFKKTRNNLSPIIKKSQSFLTNALA